MRAKIIQLGKRDAHYDERNWFVGKVGILSKDVVREGEWVGGEFTFENPIPYFSVTLDSAIFAYIKVEEVK